MLEKDYPYKGVQTSCKATEIVQNTKITSFGRVESGNQEAIKQAIMANGGVSAGINASLLMIYKSGILKSEECPRTVANLNHAVTIIGWGSENGDGYWIVQNSWSALWGEAGYFKIYRDGSSGPGTCGIQLDNTYVAF